MWLKLKYMANKQSGGNVQVPRRRPKVVHNSLTVCVTQVTSLCGALDVVLENTKVLRGLRNALCVLLANILTAQ